MICSNKRFLILIFLLSCKTTAPVSSSKFIGGRQGSSKTFPATVKLALPGGTCTATKVAPKKFLTAAHCVKDESLQIGARFQMEFGTEEDTYKTYDIKIAGLKLSTESLPPEPTASSASARNGVDLAVLEINIETPEVRVAKVSDIALQPHQEIVIGGVGCQKDVLSPGSALEPEIEGIPLRFGIVKVDEVWMYHFTSERFDINGSEARPCPGDSGGGVFLREGDGPYTTIVGVNSFRAVQGGLWGAYTRLDSSLPDNVKLWLKDAGIVSRSVPGAQTPIPSVATPTPIPPVSGNMISLEGKSVACRQGSLFASMVLLEFEGGKVSLGYAPSSGATRRASDVNYTVRVVAQGQTQYSITESQAFGIPATTVLTVGVSGQGRAQIRKGDETIQLTCTVVN